jgi:predicted nucleotidyltransferase
MTPFNATKNIQLGVLPEFLLCKNTTLNSFLLSLLQDLQDCFAYEPDIEKVILFGSFTKGSQCNDSDLDILVLLREQGIHATYKKRLERSSRISRLCNPLRERISIDVLVYTNDEWKYLLNKNSLFLKEVQRGGVIVYERNSQSNIT